MTNKQSGHTWNYLCFSSSHFYFGKQFLPIKENFWPSQTVDSSNPKITARNYLLWKNFILAFTMSRKTFDIIPSFVYTMRRRRRVSESFNGTNSFITNTDNLNTYACSARTEDIKQQLNKTKRQRCHFGMRVGMN